MPTRIEVPKLSLVVLMGTSGSGKTDFAHAHFRATEVLSSDEVRAMISDDPARQDIHDDAFDVLHRIADKRLKLGRLTVIDATNLETRARQPLRVLAKKRLVSTVVIVLDVPLEVCLERDRARARVVGEEVIRHQRALLERSLGKLPQEGFRRVHVLDGPEAIGAVKITRARMPSDLRELRGPFDVIGDVHGCAEELAALLAKLGWVVDDHGVRRHPEGRTAVFLGDLVDRGPDTPGALKIAMAMVDAGVALCVKGNHEAKLERWLDEKRVNPSHGLAASIEQLEREPEGFRRAVRRFVRDRPSHYELDGGRLVVAHAGLKEHMHGRTGGKVRAFALYGDTTGETDDLGLPVRRDWAREYEGDAAVVYGHTPTRTPQWVNGTICVDTGCVFGGALTALRWPERELVQVHAVRTWYEPTRPID